MIQDASILCLERPRFHKDAAARRKLLRSISSTNTFSPRTAPCLAEGLGHEPRGLSRHRRARLRHARQGARSAEQAGDRDGRRRQGLHQDRSSGEPRHQGRRAGDRRRHGQHLPHRARRRRRASRCARTTWRRRARPHHGARPKTSRLPPSSCRSTPSWRTSSPPMRRTAATASTPLTPTGMILDVGPHIGRAHQ